MADPNWADPAQQDPTGRSQPTVDLSPFFFSNGLDFVAQVSIFLFLILGPNFL